MKTDDEEVKEFIEQEHLKDEEETNIDKLIISVMFVIVIILVIGYFSIY